MKIKKLLISQPAPQSDRSPYFDLAEKHNLKIDFQPFIKIQGVDVADYRKQKVNILEHSAVIVTSRTAIDNYFRLAEEMRLTIPTSMKFFCTSESIAYYLQKYITYRKRKIFYGEKTFDDLLEVMKKHRQEKFLLPVAEIHKSTIPTKLKKNKYSFTKTIMFKTVSEDLSKLKIENYDLLVFFSPSGLTSLVENFPKFKQNGTKIASFGPTTAKSVKTAGFNLDIKAPSKEFPSMAKAIEDYIKNNE